MKPFSFFVNVVKNSAISATLPSVKRQILRNEFVLSKNKIGYTIDIIQKVCAKEVLLRERCCRNTYREI